MAPALPIYSREEIEKMYPKSEGFNRVPDNCHLYNLFQNECTYDGNKVICLPFKRVFMRCLEYKSNEYSGYKIQGKNSRRSGENTDLDDKLEEIERVYRNVEITSRKDNKVESEDPQIREFLEADLVLKKNMREYYRKEKAGD